MRLINYFILPLVFLRHFQMHPSGDLTTVQNNIDELVAGSLREATEAGIGNADIQNALFAVVAWADEVFLSAPWSGAGEWGRHLLQRRHFNITKAGDLFFQRLESLGEDEIQVREIFFYCLCMGFAGRYGYDRNSKALADIRQANLNLMLHVMKSQTDRGGVTSEMEKMMFPNVYSHMGAAANDLPAKSANPWRWKLSSLTTSVLVTPLIILLVLYGVYHIVISQIVNSLLASVA
jgi:type VI secretion system protein ImpK